MAGSNLTDSRYCLLVPLMTPICGYPAPAMVASASAESEVAAFVPDEKVVCISETEAVAFAAE